MNLIFKLKLLLYWCLSLVTFVPIMVIVFFPLKIWKSLIIYYTQLFFKNEIGKPLTGYDSIFAIDDFYNDKSYAGNVTFFIIEGKQSIENITKGFIENILSLRNKEKGNKPQFEKLFQVPTKIFGYYFWKTISVNIKKQIREEYYDFNEMTSHEDQLNGILGKLMTSPFQKGCSLWELILYNGYNTTQSVLVFRLHHALGDGYSFNHLVDRMIQKSSTYLVKTSKRGFLEKVDLLFTAPLKMVKLYGEAFTEKDIYTQKKVNSTGVVSTTTISLTDMKNIRRRTNSHFATVGMSILSGAMRRYYLENNSPSDLPPVISIMHSLPKSNHPITEMTNHWGVGVFKIPMKTENALERLYGAETNFKNYMADQFNELIQSHVPTFNLLPESMMRLFFSTNFGTSMGFTSVPAYDKEAFLFGKHRIHNMFKVFGLQWAQTAVAAAAYTYNGKVSFTVFANKDIIPDQIGVDRVTQNYIHSEVQDLLKQCGLQPTLPKITTNTTQLKINRSFIRTEGFA